jgi:LmbE family N-acetylglucosaminyl deacetylase
MERLNRQKLLVIAAHQDDETIIASGAMQQVKAAGGEVQVVYTTDGGGKTTPGSGQRRELVHRRNDEALTALALAGVVAAHVHFLGFESGAPFQTPDIARKVFHAVQEIIGAFQSDIMIVGAFEGGNLEHDITNFLAVRAATAAGLARTQILEAAEYNRFYLREPVYARLRKIFPGGFGWPPRFPRGVMGTILPMTENEQAIKRKMLECFVSQKHVRLGERFGFAECFRAMPEHDYCAGPFNPDASWRYRLQRLLAGSSAFPFAQRDFGPSEYRQLFKTLQTALS